MANETKRCAHRSCLCLAREGSSYCSTICEDSKNVTTLQCDCGDARCARQTL